MKIKFSCLGFHSTEVVLEKPNGSQHFVGYLSDHTGEMKFDLFEGGLWERHIKPNEVPDENTIVEEYNRRLKENNYKSSLNPDDIVYAG